MSNPEQQVLAKARVTEAFLETLADNVPKNFAPYVRQATPYVLLIGKGVDAASPYITKAQEYGEKAWKVVEPYDPQDLAPALMGLVLVFFGGHFLTLIAAVEAFRMTGWDTTKKSLRDLYENYKKAKEASDKDDMVDADGDGVADVLQIDKKELITRKIRLVLKSTDPEKVSDAIAAVCAGWFGVLATLRVRFAQAITLGATIGDILAMIANKWVRTPIEKVVPEEYKKWVGPVIKYGCKSFGISLAWTVQRVISALHSGIRGAQLFTTNGLAYLKKRGHAIPPGLEENSAPVLAFTFLLATYGFVTQLSSGFYLPFPLNILLLPLRFAEWFLMQYVAHQ